MAPKKRTVVDRETREMNAAFDRAVDDVVAADAGETPPAPKRARASKAKAKPAAKAKASASPVQAPDFEVCWANFEKVQALYSLSEEETSKVLLQVVGPDPKYGKYWSRFKKPAQPEKTVETSDPSAKESNPTPAPAAPKALPTPKTLPEAPKAKAEAMPPPPAPVVPKSCPPPEPSHVPEPASDQEEWEEEMHCRGLCR